MAHYPNRNGRKMEFLEITSEDYAKMLSSDEIFFYIVYSPVSVAVKKIFR